ncbi:hypothetical protein [Spirosoma gilvum]
MKSAWNRLFIKLRIKHQSQIKGNANLDQKEKDDLFASYRLDYAQLENEDQRGQMICQLGRDVLRLAEKQKFRRSQLVHQQGIDLDGLRSRLTVSD